MGIPDGVVDLAILVDVRQEDTKDAFLDSIHAAMTPGGIVVIVHVKSSHLQEPEQAVDVHRRTVDDFVRHGFEPGRRVLLVDERVSAEVLEFRRPPA